MPKSRKLVIEILSNLLFAALFYGIFAVAVYVVSGSRWELLRLGLIVVFFAINFFLRRVSKVLGVLIAVHLVVPSAVAAVVLLLIPFSWLGVVWIVISVAAAGYSIWYVIRGVSVTDSYITVTDLAFIAISLWAAWAGHWHLVALYPSLLVFMVVGRTVVAHMVEMDMSLEAIQLASTQPVKQIITFDYKLAAGLAVFMIGGAVILHLLILSPIIAALWDIFPGLPRPMLDLNFETTTEYQDMYIPAEPQAPDHISEYFQDVDRIQFTIPRFIVLLFQILIGGVILAVIIGVIYTIMRSIIYFLGRRVEAHEPEDFMGEAIDEKEFVFPKSKILRKRNTNEHPIRRLFRETAKKHVKMGVPIEKSDTPTDMANRIQAEDISGLTKEYAQVRYKN